MTDSQAPEKTGTEISGTTTTGTNPLAPTPLGVRTAADVVTPELVAQLTKGVTGSGRTANHTPFTGEKLADLPESTPDDVLKAFEAARRAQEVWERTPVRERAAVLLRFHDLVLERQAEVLDLIQLPGRGPWRTNGRIPDEGLGGRTAGSWTRGSAAGCACGLSRECGRSAGVRPFLTGRARPRSAARADRRAPLSR
ncbi:aldehyde dehydrogenase family protein [Streptomyces asoensis]